MNIVKFKDIILDAENAPQLTPKERKLFNDKFRGRYVYNVNWNYCIPLESITEEEYIQLSQDLSSDIHRHAIWKNEDTILAVSIVKYMEVPVYDGPEPTKEPTVSHIYKFDDWVPELEPITEDTTYQAHFEEILRKYEVRWVNYDGTLIKSELVDYGETPVYEGEEPAKPSTPQYHYSFIGWDPEVRPVDGDVTYMATFEEEVNQYTIRFVNYDYTLLEEHVLDYGETPIYEGEEPTRPEDFYKVYYFEGWSPDVVTVVEDATYIAQYEFDAKYHEITDSIYIEDAYEKSADMSLPDDDHMGLDRWAKFKVKISNSGVYQIADTFESLYSELKPGYTGHQWRFTIQDEYGNVVDTFDGPSVWPNTSPETKIYDITWNISNTGLYVLKVENILEWGKPRLRELHFEKIQ